MNRSIELFTLTLDLDLWPIVTFIRHNGKIENSLRCYKGVGKFRLPIPKQPTLTCCPTCSLTVKATRICSFPYLCFPGGFENERLTSV
jgi:hypothetical protein